MLPAFLARTIYPIERSATDRRPVWRVNDLRPFLPRDNASTDLVTSAECPFRNGLVPAFKSRNHECIQTWLHQLLRNGQRLGHTISPFFVNTASIAPQNNAVTILLKAPSRADGISNIVDQERRDQRADNPCKCPWKSSHQLHRRYCDKDPQNHPRCHLRSGQRIARNSTEPFEAIEKRQHQNRQQGGPKIRIGHNHSKCSRARNQHHRDPNGPDDEEGMLQWQNRLRFIEKRRPGNRTAVFGNQR